MWDYFLFFLLGVLTTKALQALLNIITAYNVLKKAEIVTLAVMLESEAWRIQAITILELVYTDVERQEEFEKIKESVNKRYKEVQDNVLAIMKLKLPYQVPYTNLSEAAEHFKANTKGAKHDR
jgi:hypothetical protein